MLSSTVILLKLFCLNKTQDLVDRQLRSLFCCGPTNNQGVFSIQIPLTQLVDCSGSAYKSSQSRLAFSHFTIPNPTNAVGGILHWSGATRFTLL